MDCKQTQRDTEWPTHRQAEEHTKKKSKKPILPVFNAGPSNTEHLYYALDVEGVTLKGSLLPAHIRQSKQ